MEESRRVRMTKRLIRDALLDLMEEETPSKISVTEICEAADVNRSTFYAYYQNVAHLLEEIERDVLGQIPALQGIEPIESNEAFMELVVGFFEYVRRNEKLFRVLMLKADNRDFHRHLVEGVMERVHQLSPKEGSDASRYVHVYVVNGVIGLLQEWLRQGFPIDSRRLAQLVVRTSIQANMASIAVLEEA